MNLVEYTDDSDTFEHISREQIEACEDPSELNRWRGALEDARDWMHSQMDAHRAAQVDDEEWAMRAIRKLSYIEMGRKRVLAKLRVLGVETSVLREQIESLERQVSLLRPEVAYAREFIRVAKDLMPDGSATRIHVEAESRLQARAVRRSGAAVGKDEGEPLRSIAEGAAG